MQGGLTKVGERGCVMPNIFFEDLSDLTARVLTMNKVFPAAKTREETEFLGEAALRYADTLKKVRVDADAWVVEYLDEVTGEAWVMDYPESEMQGGGSPRLRKRERA